MVPVDTGQTVSLNYVAVSCSALGMSKKIWLDVIVVICELSCETAGSQTPVY